MTAKATRPQGGTSALQPREAATRDPAPWPLPSAHTLLAVGGGLLNVPGTSSGSGGSAAGTPSGSLTVTWAARPASCRWGSRPPRTVCRRFPKSMFWVMSLQTSAKAPQSAAAKKVKTHKPPPSHPYLPPSLFSCSLQTPCIQPPAVFQKHHFPAAASALSFLTTANPNSPSAQSLRRTKLPRSACQDSAHISAPQRRLAGPPGHPQDSESTQAQGTQTRGGWPSLGGAPSTCAQHPTGSDLSCSELLQFTAVGSVLGTHPRGQERPGMDPSHTPQPCPAQRCGEGVATGHGAGVRG